jgi:hypothetical protein
MNPTNGLDFVNLTFIYVNKSKEICKINNDLYFFHSDNTLTKSELVRLLQLHKNNNGTEYSVLSVLKYNATNDGHVFQEISKLDDIRFLNSEHYISDLNDVYFLFAERAHDSVSAGQTRRIFVRGGVGKSKNTRRRHIIKKMIL